MLIQINDKLRIVSNPCGGFDSQTRATDKNTGQLKCRKDGRPIWKFQYYMRTLDQIMMVCIMESEKVLDKTMDDVTQILDAIKTTKDEVIHSVEVTYGGSSRTD